MTKIGAALATLETEHRALLVRLAKVKAAINALHALKAPRSPPAPSAVTGAELPPAIREALARGPVAPTILCRETGCSKQDLKTYLAEGLVTASGVTKTRRYALPAPPAKEAP